MLYALSLLFVLVAITFGDDDSPKEGIEFVSQDSKLVSFYLYNDPKNCSYFNNIKIDDPMSFEASGFDPARNITLIVHGFNSNGFEEFPQVMKNAFLNAGLHDNLVVVDWHWWSLDTPIPQLLATNFYGTVFANIPRIAQRVCLFVTFINDVYGASAIRNIHVIGHSMGAHISGVAARCVRKKTGIIIDRISGLDPAGPLFDPPTAGRSLLQSDAKLVDVYHTNMGLEGTTSLDGSMNALINGGRLQPGCAINDTGLVDPMNGIGGCSHNFAYRLYTASITKPFYGCQCTNTSITGHSTCNGTMDDCTGSTRLGYYVTHTARGLYYVNTTLED